ncbi:hypothetical protein CMO83_03110 [Candidatus Woesearchaeota archaeon]|jgi:hypothetical protein|nr:hypothetical protein [Candidatus Woesearchaeota archaeon]|tara:strand:- start:15350 stop:15703 length:354 start_codon:yes stop_codon:yes gene_type:complete
MLKRGLVAVTAYNYAFVQSYNTAGHLINNYLNPKGLGKALTQGVGKQWRDIGLLFSPFYIGAANNISHLGLGGYYAPIFAAGALPVGFALKKWFEKGWNRPGSYSSPMPQYAAAGAH